MIFRNKVHHFIGRGVFGMSNPDNTSMKITSGRDSHYKSADVKSRPSSEPKSRKDFKKVLEKDEEDQNLASQEILEETDGITLAMNEKLKKSPPPSIFDLTSGKTAIHKDSRNTDVPHVESPSQIYSKLTTVDTKKEAKENLFDLGNVPLLSEKDKFNTRFATEQTDLSYINPLAATTNQQPSVNLSISTEKAVIPVSHIQEIINQMIDKVNEIKQTGTTQTIITLKHPPTFEGATIIVTAFDHAKNEFNITIENLTQTGKHLMDQQANKDTLLLALEQKGYAVHILSTTTLAENRPVASLPQQDQPNKQNDESREEKQQRRNQKQT